MNEAKKRRQGQGKKKETYLGRVCPMVRVTVGRCCLNNSSMIGYIRSKINELIDALGVM